jgi:hypothetical protein
MKRLHLYLPVFFMLFALQADAIDIYVSPNGSDNNDGSKEKPLATISMALRKARDLRRINDVALSTGIHILLKGGIYTLNETVFIRPEDAGTSTSPTIIEAVAGEQPVLSGGIIISGWKKSISIPNLPVIAKGKIWEAPLPTAFTSSILFRQLWINGRKAVRAKSANGELMHRILDWNKKDASCWIPALPFDLSKSLPGLEMFIQQWWAIAMLRISKIEKHGDSTKLFFKEPESKIQNEHPWPAPWLSKETGNSAFYLVNALQFLDEPGEWYADVLHSKLYYWPRQGENMPTVSAIAPLLETLVKIEGTIDQPVSQVYFKGISFQHTGWLRPSMQGHVPHQAGMFMTEAYKLKPAGTKEKPFLDNQAWVGRPAAAVEISYAEKTGFENCRFEHLASTALDYNKGAHGNTIIGNLFKDIGGTAILAGVYSDESMEIHLAYHPKDEREVTDAMTITNNFITDAGNEDWSCVGIGIGYTRNTIVASNEIENTPYTAISMGWGWNAAENVMKNNIITRNKIHHYGKHNYDCAGIYTLSAQPGTVISENYIDSIYKAPYAHLPSHWFYLYTDEGSSYMTVKDNWTPSEKFLRNANGPGNEWSNNGPSVAEKIKQNAGLEPNYKYLNKEATSPMVSLPVNEEHSEVIEIVARQGESIDQARLKKVLTQNNVDSNAVYQWKNHYVIFARIQDVSVLHDKLKNLFPETEVKAYYDMFYEFRRKKQCGETSEAKQWEHILLTVNLVADNKKQQEYLDYHATQFEKWPEVSRGFCNADFQQLLIFRNGRQLILVISIPKGETLDKLNPKTTENNPRVDEWNKLMSKYQQGIEGTKKGGTWVFLEKMTSGE